MSVAHNVTDFRDSQSRVFDLSLVLFCLLLGEFRNCRRQRQLALWLQGNWEWIADLWENVAEIPAPENSPSQSTLSRVLQNVDIWAISQQFHAALRARTAQKIGSIRTKRTVLRHYCLDGKAREGCVSPKSGRTEIDFTIFDSNDRTVLASRTLADKQGEAPAARSVLRHSGRDLAPGIFTGDPAYTSPKLTETIINTGHQYLLGLKGNAGKVYEICKHYEWDSAALIAESEDKAHGRLEVRKLQRISLSHTRKPEFSKYASCSYLFRIESRRIKAGKASLEHRYFIGSKGLQGISAADLLSVIRKHWLQENGLHWPKDAILGEDDAPVMSNRGSRVRGFLRSLVVSAAFAICKSVQEFVDRFAAFPKELSHLLFAKALAKSTA